jgi:hypothetical protein
MSGSFVGGVRPLLARPAGRPCWYLTLDTRRTDAPVVAGVLTTDPMIAARERSCLAGIEQTPQGAHRSYTSNCPSEHGTSLYELSSDPRPTAASVRSAARLPMATTDANATLMPDSLGLRMQDLDEAGRLNCHRWVTGCHRKDTLLALWNHARRGDSEPERRPGLGIDRVLEHGPSRQLGRHRQSRVNR